MGQSIEDFVADVISDPTKYGVYNGNYSALRKAEPKFNSWWIETSDKLRSIGVANPNPITQYELIEAKSEGLNVVNQNVECK